jgi:hypothetical protein
MDYTMQALQYILLILFSIVIAVFIKPTQKYRDYHLLVFGGVLSLSAILLSIFLGREAVRVILLEDTWGPGRGVVLGYAILIGVLMRMFARVIFNRKD